MNIERYKYNLPKELIAQYPLERGSERLAVIDRSDRSVHDRRFGDLLDYLRPDDIVVFNDTRVIHARLIGRKETGGRVEVLILKAVTGHTWNCIAKSSKPLKQGSKIIFDDDLEGEVEKKTGSSYDIRFSDPSTLSQKGQVPLPPYIERTPEETDRDSYQTIYASQEGSVAAPTAGLHFTEGFMERMRALGIETVFITLHVGIGTFRPVRTQRIQDHVMHSEEFEVSDQAADAINRAYDQGRRIVAIGTTTTRVLEHLFESSGRIIPGPGSTDMFIHEGFRFSCVGALLTNFHLPCSTLLILVCAFGGYSLIMDAYRQAIENRYRFFSYGDAMFIF